ncbi:multicopper oxidase family protein [Cryobacterium sp. TMT1-2-1]|uniref:multicopper oxidase family protein n=1 Tax=Cryobacterium sp. TMT1-2-1 TaxID=1259232 RepID=UPI00106C1BBF|nr:multicopper oxidase family protein [Cryobacterium sp. TMT1-2-1]TFD44681.1 multicopper oxidase family protein [Cryobacterium sp. TMT1-2-1]
MEPISRRGALTLGGLGLAGTVVGGAGLLWTSSLADAAQPQPGEELAEPSELRSANGRLQLRLDAALGTVQIGGRSASALSFNGGIPGPTLRLKAGDRLGVALHNGLDDPTNLHVHGLHVSPEGNGDNPFVMIEPGESFDYEYQLPANHPPGLYWYHPHHHGFVADQIFGGLYGAIIVDDPEPIEAARERVLVISDITLDGLGRIPAVSQMEQMLGREGELVLVNGQVNPRMSARPAERERWRIVNACVSRYLRLRLDGQRMQLLGIDSGRFGAPETVDEIVLAPGNRADLLVTMADGTAVLETLPYDRGGPGGMMGGGERPRSGTSTGRVSLATLTVAGEEVAAPPTVPAQPAPRDLRGRAVTARRELTFAMGMDGMMGGGGGMMSFTINGREFDGDRVDTTVEAGSVEEWSLRNTSPMDHPVHLHVWPMQIVESDGRAPDTAIWQDVVNVPARGQIRVRIAFDDFAGRSVYHCHILDHEDNGMMGVIEVR